MRLLQIDPIALAETFGVPGLIGGVTVGLLWYFLRQDRRAGGVEMADLVEDIAQIDRKVEERHRQARHDVERLERSLHGIETSLTEIKVRLSITPLNRS